VSPTLHPDLLGRDAALARIEAWADELGDGPSAVVISGEPGIGKSALWRAAIDLATGRDAMVLAARPVEAELPLGYAALADLLGDVIEAVLPHLPGVQATALEAALGRRSSPTAVDPLLVARALVSSLNVLVERGPVVLAIDDAQWLDAPSARGIGYAVRRGPARLGLALTVRAGQPLQILDAGAFAGRLFDVPLEGLSLGAIAHLLRERSVPPLPRRRLAQLHQQARGNPFYALELARASGSGLPVSLADGLAGHLAEAPPSAQAAIEEVAVLGPRPLAAFADLAGVDGAVEVGILAADAGGVHFAHPLLAAAAYERIPPGRRRALHATAATVATSAASRARHLALATTGPDEATAALVQAAAHAERLRGAPEAAVDLAGHARRLTPPERADELAARTVDEAEFRFLAADEAGAEALVDAVIAGQTRGVTRVRALAQRALTEVTATAAVARLEEAVGERHDDRRLAARTLAQLAWQRGAWLGDVEPATVEAREAVALAEAVGDDATLATALTTLGLLQSLSPGSEARDADSAAASFRRAVEISGRSPTSPGDHSPNLAFAHERFWRGDFAEAEALLDAERRRAEEHGDEGLLMRIAIFSADFELRRGRWAESQQLLDEALVEAQAYWRLSALTTRGILRGRRGDPSALEDAAELTGSPVAAGDPVFAAVGAFVTGLLLLADGDVAGGADQLARLPEATATHPSRAAEFGVVIPETVAALAAAGDLDRARRLTGVLERRLPQFDPWGLAAIAQCRGVIALAEADLDEARAELQVAIAGYQGIGAPWDLGQALLAAGMTERRAGRRTEAGELLDRAAGIFERLGAEPARRTVAAELTRARPRRRSDDSLTAAEARVAALAAAGRTNREIAALQFTTVATVEAHLTRSYSKLGIRSRTDLARLVSSGALTFDDSADPPPAGAPPAAARQDQAYPAAPTRRPPSKAR
jgi:DNA-binding CsgD family transcriptional regulator